MPYAPVVATSRGRPITRSGNVAARVFVVPVFATVGHPLIPSREFEDEFNLMHLRPVCLVPVVELTVGRCSSAHHKAVPLVVIVAVVRRCTKGRGHIKQQARDAANVRRGHRSTGDGHVVQVTLRPRGGVDGRSTRRCGPNVTTGGAEVWPRVLLRHASPRRKRRHGRSIVRQGRDGNGRRGVGVHVGPQVAGALTTGSSRI